MTFHEPLLSLAASHDWIALGMNLILSTIVGGLVIIGLLAVLTKLWGESVKAQNAFMLVLVVNLITFIGLLGLLSSLPPALLLALPLLVWIGLTKAFFTGLGWKHALVTGVVGYALSILLIPGLTALVAGYVPKIG